MKNSTLWTIVIVIIIIGVLAFIFWGAKDQGNSSYDETGVEAFDQSISDGAVKISFSSEDFGLATNATQILTEASVPPCSGDFIYCVYYKGKAYNGTNFESAGIRISKRADLATESVCLNTPPNGYDNSVVPNTLKPQAKVSTSLFKDLSDSGAGHLVVFSVYRLFNKAIGTSTTAVPCYEFQTTIAKESASNNQSFTDDEANKLNARMTNMLKNITLNGDLGDIFPPY